MPLKYFNILKINTRNYTTKFNYRLIYKSVPTNIVLPCNSDTVTRAAKAKYLKSTLLQQPSNLKAAKAQQRALFIQLVVLLLLLSSIADCILCTQRFYSTHLIHLSSQPLFKLHHSFPHFT